MNIGKYGLIAVFFAAIWQAVRRLQASVSQTVPLGYEDEAGFHFGVPSLDE